METNSLASPEAEGWSTRVDVVKVVVVIGDGCNLVLTVVVRVPNEGCFPVLFGR